MRGGSHRKENKKGLFEKAKNKIVQLGETKDRVALLLKARNLMQNEDLAEAIADAVVKNRGELGYVLSALKERPRTFNPNLLKGMTVYEEPKALNPQTSSWWPSVPPQHSTASTASKRTWGGPPPRKQASTR